MINLEELLICVVPNDRSRMGYKLLSRNDKEYLAQTLAIKWKENCLADGARREKIHRMSGIAKLSNRFYSYDISMWLYGAELRILVDDIDEITYEEAETRKLNYDRGC